MGGTSSNRYIVPASLTDDDATSAPHEPTTIGALVTAIATTLAARGIDSDAVFRKAGLNRVPANDPLDRITPSAVAAVFAAAVDATAETNIGLEVARNIRPITLHALGYSLSASDTLRDFGERLARFARLVSRASNVRFVVAKDEARIEITRWASSVCVEAEDAWIGFLVSFMRDLSNGRFAPTLVQLRRPVPADGGTAHRAFFRCPLEFGLTDVTIHLDASIIDVPLTGASRELAAVNDRLVVDYLAKLDRREIEDQVRALLVRELPVGGITKAAVARKLNMSARTLQSRLAQRQTSFYELINETRRSLALAYIENRSMPLTEVAYLLGFTDSSNFSRAFKRWTGVSPSGHRAELARGR